MFIQPRGFKRIPKTAALLESINKRIDAISEQYSCSRSFVIATLLADQLGITEQIKYYDYIKTRTSKARRKSKAGRNKQRKRHAA